MTSVFAADKTPEEIANAILLSKLSQCRRVGFAKSTDDILLMEYDVHLYQAALNSDDKKLKALLAIQALQSLSETGIGQDLPLTNEDNQHLTRFRVNPDYIKLRKWYINLNKRKL